MRKKMRLIKIWGIAPLALALTQCAVQEVEAPRKAPANFEVFASPVETRTTNSGMSTLWVVGDKFNLFHASAGTPSFVSDDVFTVDNASTGHARGSVSGLTEGAYDWYMVYPYAESASKPTEVPVLVGAAFEDVQTQNGKNSMSHLAGEGFPLGGKALKVPSTEIPVLTVSPLMSVLAVNVTNPGASSRKVSVIRFKAPEAIAGSFKVDITGDTPYFQEIEASHEAELFVLNARLAAGESAVFYIGIKPFVAPAGSTLVLMVNDQERTVTLDREVTFSAGKIKTLNMTLDESEPGTQYYFKRVNTVTPGHKYLIVAEDTKQGGLRMAGPFPEWLASGRMDADVITEAEEGIIVLDHLDNAFTFIENNGSYTIRQWDGRYLYNNNKDDVFVGDAPSSGHLWSISFTAEGFAVLANSSRRLQYNPTTSVQKFQLRQSSSSVGQNPWLYELQNDEEAAADLLKKSVPGVYDYQGMSWTYADRVSQTSVRTLAGTVAFRLFYPADYTVVQVTGIPADLQVNDRFEIRMVRFEKLAAIYAGNFAVTVLKVEDGKAWLLGDGGTGFIVNIQ